MQKESKIRDPLILGKKTYHDITVDIAKPVLGKANKYWWVLFSLSVVLMLWGFACMAYTIGTGIGAWGLNKTIDWYLNNKEWLSRVTSGAYQSYYKKQYKSE